jgi:hypothetical protein
MFIVKLSVMTSMGVRVGLNTKSPLTTPKCEYTFSMVVIIINTLTKWAQWNIQVLFKKCEFFFFFLISFFIELLV